MSEECNESECGLPYRGGRGSRGFKGDNGVNGANGTNGTNGTNGLHGRGVAIFVQSTQPTSANFNTKYGTVPGFGTSFIPNTGANALKAGDIWIGLCTINVY